MRTRKAIREQARDAAIVAHPVFVAQGWTWFNTEPNVPSLGELTTHIINLLHEAETRQSLSVSSGRIIIFGIENSEGGRDYEVAVEIDSGWTDETDD